MNVSIHLRNQLLAAISHARRAHTGPLSVDNTITDAVARTIEQHAACRYCEPAEEPGVDD